MLLPNGGSVSGIPGRVNGDVDAIDQLKINGDAGE